MVKSYRAIQQWNQWLNNHLGKELLAFEKKCLAIAIEHCYGKHALLIGVPKQLSLLETSHISNRLLITPQTIHDTHLSCIEANWNELPISTGSVDLVIVPHSLEYMDNPRKMLAEACRIVKPEGSLIIFGFNPLSLWGLYNFFDKLHGHPDRANFLSASLVKKWLALNEFELLQQKTLLFRPPFKNESIFRRLKILEWIGDKTYLPLGGVYMLIAKAKVIPLTPIRLHWKQQLAGIKLSIPGPSLRNTDEKSINLY